MPTRTKKRNRTRPAGGPKRAFAQGGGVKASLIAAKLEPLMADEALVRTFGKDFFAARRYVVRCLWNLGEGELRLLTDDAVRVLLFDAVMGLRDLPGAAEQRRERKVEAAEGRLNALP